MAHSERKYREFADSLPEIVFEVDEKGTPSFLNKRVSQIMGYSNEEIKQMNVLQFLVPEDRQRAKENIQRIMQGETSSGHQYLVLKKDGSTFPAMIFTEKILIDNDNVGLRGIVVNNSKAKQTEKDLQMLNEKLRVVSGLTRHDVANKLMVIKSNSYLLKKQIGDNPKFAKYLEDIDSALKSSEKILEFNRLYEKIGAEKPANMNVADCFNKAATILPNLDAARFANECQGLEVMADSMLEQLFYNLIDNSLKHGEKVTQIKLYCIEEEKQIKLFYEDNGVGIPETNKVKVFEKGFSTGNGSGLGLLLIKKIIEVYGWSITEEGEPGKGAKFVITIPRLTKSEKKNYQILTES